MKHTLHTIKTRNVTVRFNAVNEDSPDLSWCEPEDLRKIEQGVWEVFCLETEIFVNGLKLGTSYLGNCVYERPVDVIWGGYGRGELAEAVKEARCALSGLQTLRLRS